MEKVEASEGSMARVLRLTWRQLDWDMSGGAHHDRASIGGGEALEHFQNQKKLLSKHGRIPSLRINKRRRERIMIAWRRRYFRGRASNPQQRPFTESLHSSLVIASQ